MKKTIALLSALCLLCAGTGVAVEYGPGQTNAATEVRVTVEESYTVVIPATLDIPFGAPATSLPVQVTALRVLSTDVGAGRALYVQADSADCRLKSPNGDAIRYAFGENGGDTLLRFTAPGTQNFSINITKASWDAAPAGSYAGDVTFQIRIDNT